MKKYLLLFSGYSLLLMAITSSCNKEKSPDDQPSVPVDSGRYIVSFNQSQLVTNPNGFRFESAFGTAEPAAYPYLWVQYADDYNDSTRVVILNQNDDKTITKHLVVNTFNGNISRKFDHGSFPNNVSNSMSFAFEHPSFLLFWYDKVNGTITQTATIYGMNAQVSQIFTGMQDQYSYQFLNRYLIRYISGISLWPFNHANWYDETQFVATSELSAPKAIGHYFDETYASFPYDVVHNMYSGFFQSTFDGTYAGIAKGSANLDTVMLNKNPPDWYNAQLCKAYIDKVGDTLYLGILTNLPNEIQMVASLYRMVEGSGEMTELYSNLSFSYQNVWFRRGAYYTFTSTNGKLVMLNTRGQEEIIPLPVSTSAVSIMMSKNKIFAIANDMSSRRVEIFSKDL